MTKLEKRKKHGYVYLNRLDATFIMGTLDALSAGNDTNPSTRARTISNKLWRQLK